MKLYKLTERNMTTYNGRTRWTIGVRSKGKTGNRGLCSSSCYHAYASPEHAVIFNEIHGQYRNPKLFEAEGNVKWDDKMKVGCRSLVLLRELPIPTIPTVVRVACALLYSLPLIRNRVWGDWAIGWLYHQMPKPLRGLSREGLNHSACDIEYVEYSARVLANALNVEFRHDGLSTIDATVEDLSLDNIAARSIQGSIESYVEKRLNPPDLPTIVGYARCLCDLPRDE